MQNNTKTRLINSGRLVWILFAVCAFSVHAEVATNLIFMKLMLVPMFFFALPGVAGLYKKPINEQPLLSANFIEYHLLMGFLLTAFLLFVVWTPDVEIPFLVKWLLLGTFAGMLWGLAIALIERRRNS
ncbi:MAG: hypothetical protein AB8B97_04650 [Granulosicoccus sp.]